MLRKKMQRGLAAIEALAGLDLLLKGSSGIDMHVTSTEHDKAWIGRAVEQ